MKSLLLIPILVLINSLGFAHLCHDPFRPKERLVLVPEKDLIRIEEEGEFRMYIENTFSSTLRDVQLFVENEALEIQVSPKVLKNLLPGERAFFLIKLKLRKGFRPGDYPLRISVSARSAELRPTIEKMVVAIEEKKVEPKIEEKKVLLPEKEPTPPKEEVLSIEERPLEPLKEEEQIEVSQEKQALPPTPEVPHIPEEAPPIAEEAVEPQEEVQEEVVVRVEKLPFWKKPYFYIILISLLLALLIWRKLKMG